MADKRYYWLKLKRDFFKRHDIRIIEDMPNGKDYVLFYLKLLVESVDHEGALRFSDTIPYNENMLSTITNTNIDLVRTAMKVFTELHMIDVLDNQTIFMNEVQGLLGTETYWAEQKRKQKFKALNPKEFKYITVINKESILLPNGKVQYVDNKRYGGNGFLAFENAAGVCEVCGTSENLCIHHKNEYSNDIEDLSILCRSCHRKTEVGKSPENVLLVSNLSKQEKEKDIEIELEKDKSTAPAKREHGQYGWVKLTDAEYQKLLSELGQAELARCIDYVDTSAEKTKNKNGWKSWIAVIRNCHKDGWGLKAGRVNKSFAELAAEMEGT